LGKMEKTLESHQDNRNHKDSYLIKDDERMIIDWSKDSETSTTMTLILEQFGLNQLTN
jgi:flavorubredoxin